MRVLAIIKLLIGAGTLIYTFSELHSQWPVILLPTFCGGYVFGEAIADLIEEKGPSNV